MLSLHQAGHDIALVVTGEDRRRGRGNASSPTPVKAKALELGLPVSSKVSDVLQYEVELGVVVAFGQLIRPAVLDVVPMLNVHFSLLPRWRGAAPVERAILAGDATTGVCIMALEKALDTGPVFRRVEVAIDPDERAEQLVQRLGVLGSQALLACLEHGLSGLPEAEPQEGEATYAAKITPEDLHLDFGATTQHCYAQVRVGRAWTSFRGERLIVHDARPLVCTELDELTAHVPGELVGDCVCSGDGGLQLLVVQQAGRAPSPFAAWLQGARLSAGERLGDPAEFTSR